MHGGTLAVAINTVIGGNATMGERETISCHICNFAFLLAHDLFCSGVLF